MPKYKFDFERCNRLARASDVGVTAYLDDIFRWTADANWPVAGAVFARLNSLGTELIRPIRRLFQSSDETRKYFVIENLLPEVRPEVFDGLQPLLERIANQPTTSEIHEQLQMEVGDELSRVRSRAVEAYEQEYNADKIHPRCFRFGMSGQPDRR